MKDGMEKRKEECKRAMDRGQIELQRSTEILSV